MFYLIGSRTLEALGRWSSVDWWLPGRILGLDCLLHHRRATSLLATTRAMRVLQQPVEPHNKILVAEVNPKADTYQGWRMGADVAIFGSSRMSPREQRSS